jgi:hypothetical protein
MMMTMVLDGKPVPINPDWEMVGGPIHEQDLAEHVGGFFDAATVGGTIVNWAGDDAISVEQMVPWLAGLMGVKYEFVYTREASAYPRATDNTRRVSLVGECQVKWQDGLRRLYEQKYPEHAAKRQR